MRSYFFDHFWCDAQEKFKIKHHPQNIINCELSSEDCENQEHTNQLNRCKTYKRKNSHHSRAINPIDDTSSSEESFSSYSGYDKSSSEDKDKEFRKHFAS